MQKTIGGDRLGSGSKMKVNLHGYERSTHDLGYVWRSTMACGTLVPFLNEVALPGDTFDIHLELDVKTHPSIGPLFGSFKAQLDVFLAPIRLYNSLLHNNALNIGLNMSAVKLPVVTLTAIGQPSTPDDVDNMQINPSSLLAYLGIRGVGFNNTGTDAEREFNATAILTYYDIYKNYYANKQEDEGMVLHTPAQALIETVDDIQILHDGLTTELSNGPLPSMIIVNDPSDSIEINYTGTAPLTDQIIINTQEHGDKTVTELFQNFVVTATEITGQFRASTWGATTLRLWKYQSPSDVNTGKPSIQPFPLVNVDAMRGAILAYASETTPFDINTPDLVPYTYINQIANEVPVSLSSQEGLALKTYQSDLFNNWMQTEWIDTINTITAISTIGDSFQIDALILARKVYDMLTRIAVSGGTYHDWIDAAYGYEKYRHCETPMYMGGLIRELVFQEVVSNSQSSDQPLGTLAGKGVMAGKKKGGKMVIKVDEPSYIMGIVSLTPRVDYSQGNKWDVHLKTLDDLHKPGLDEIGFQDDINEQRAWWDTGWSGTEWVQTAAGKLPAWLNYMTNVNKTFGNFAIEQNEMFMTLNRRYEKGPTGILDLTTYIDPSKYNFIFAETSLDAQNFWTQIAVDITARRKMSAKLMPNL